MGEKERIMPEIKELEGYVRHGPRWKRWEAIPFGKASPALTRINLYIYKQDNQSIEELVSFGFYNNKSEAIRHYIKNGVQDDLNHKKILDFMEKNRAKVSQYR